MIWHVCGTRATYRTLAFWLVTALFLADLQGGRRAWQDSNLRPAA
jgi:hypothetical protein